LMIESLDLKMEYYSIPASKRPVRIPLGGGSVEMDDKKVEMGVVNMLSQHRTDEEILTRYPLTMAQVLSYRERYMLGEFVEV